MLEEGIRPMANLGLLEVHGISKRYGANAKRDGSSTLALNDVSFLVEAGEFTGIMGPSGSGKSTLLNCIATIDSPTSGRIMIDGQDVTKLGSKELSAFRRDRLGFVFQDSNLLDTLTAFENIALSLTIKKVPAGEITTRVNAVAEQLAIQDTLSKYPYQLSGGQKQRIAAARATVGHPSLILADEPTGALDSKSAAQLLDSFELLNSLGATLLMVTHDPVTASYCGRIIFIKDGKLAGQLRRGHKDRASFFNEIVAITSKIGGDRADAC